MKRIFLILFLIKCSLIMAQHHPELNWSIINTKNFNIIFDSRLENDAKRIASTIEEIYEPITKDMDVDADRYDIILTAENTVSNGYVTPIGDKSVLFPVPPQDYLSGSLNWYDTLTVHEYRHVVQQSKIRDSFMQKIRHFFFGDMGYAIIAPYFPIPQTLPMYFYEGDAVLYETLLTNGGRGRLPSFDRGLRTILLNDKNYSFSKYIFGSKRNYIPDHYVTGYYLMTYLKREYGSDVISRIANFAANYPLPLNFSVACDHVTGESMPQVFKNSMKELKKLWEEQDSKVEPISGTPLLLTQPSAYTNYTYPVKLKDNKVAVIKNGLTDLYTLTVIDENGEEEELFKVYGTLSSYKSKLLYTKRSSDKRWLYREYNDIYSYDIETREEVKITDKGRYFAPSYSSDGKQVAAVEHNEHGISSIVILDSKNGNVLNKISKQGYNISTPVWSQDNKRLAAFFTGHNGKYLGLINLENSEIIKVTEEDFIDRNHIAFYKDYLLFRSSYSGIDNIHAINLDTKEEYRVFSSRFGADFPVIVDDILIYSNYSLKGYKLEQLPLIPQNWEPLNDVEVIKVEYFDKVLKNEEITAINFSDIKVKDYEVKEYSKSRNAIDIHSWFFNPFYPLIENNFIYNEDYDDFMDVYETVIMSSNKLETLDLNLYNHINKRTERAAIGVLGQYTGLYPVINYDIRLMGNYQQDYLDLDFFESDITVAFPFIFYSDFSGHSVFLGINNSYIHDMDQNEVLDLELGYFVQHSFNDYGNPRRALHLDFSSLIGLTFYHDLEYTDDKNIQLYGTNIFRGLFSSDNLRFRHNHIWDISDSQQISDYSIYENSINYDYYNLNSDISSLLRIDYILPLFYPDFSIFNWVYYTEVVTSFGYETMLQWGDDTFHAIEISNKIYYRLFRIELFDFYSELRYTYSFHTEEYESIFFPIVINLSL